jgi:phosphopantetheine--protein transferase-like protein
VSPYPVGVDIESTTHAAIRMEELAALVCHPDELVALAALESDRRERFLYRLWVQKEAYFKALGTGLQSDLRAVRFEITPDAAIARVLDAARPAADACYVRYWCDADACVASLCLPLQDVPMVVRALAPDDCILRELDFAPAKGNSM